jgi:hypothetical protein
MTYSKDRITINVTPILLVEDKPKSYRALSRRLINLRYEYDSTSN